MSNDLPNEILERVIEWRENGYEGITETTTRLLNYWFKEDHLMEDGSKFEFRDCQREAVETLVYLYEVCEHRDLMSIQRSFDIDIPNYRPTEDNWADFCFKMATGSGKTFVMAMAIVWQLSNHINEEKAGYSSNFLIISPNLIVLDRLKEGFLGDGENEKSLFEEFPFFVPNEWEKRFDYEVKLQSESSDPHSNNILHITNVQQLYDNSNSEEENPVKSLMPEKPSDDEYQDDKDLKEILERYDDLVVINDEAHHAHSETEWNNALKDIDSESANINLQLDFTATAWDMAANQQVYLPNIVYNYPLGRAIDDNIVKDPVIAYIEERQDVPSDDLIEKYEPELIAAADQLREKEEHLDEVDEKPVLFVVCGQDENNNPVENAERTAEYFENELGFDENEILTVHTYVRNSRYGKKGDIKKSELDEVRKAAKNIDENDYKIIVSVMMLQEGWDVNNVNVILPMRAFGSDVLVEQTLGRGLRRMFPNRDDVEDRLDVIEHPSFIPVLEDKIEDNNWDIEITDTGSIQNESERISPEPEKERFDTTFPIMKGGISTTKPDFDEFDASSLPKKVFNLENLETFEPEIVRKRLKDQTEIDRKKIDFKFAKSEELYFSYVSRSIADEVSGSDFKEIYPLVKKYVKKHLFVQEIKKIDDTILKKLNAPKVRKKIIEIFIDEIRHTSKIEKEYNISQDYLLSETETFHTVKSTYIPNKSIFNKLPYDSSFEQEFMAYLDSRKEVDKFTKIFTKLPFKISYFSEEGGLKYYRPDFIVVCGNKKYLVETKGEGFDEMKDVEKKANAAESWCKSALKLTEYDWEYVKITEDVFNNNKGRSMKNITEIAD